MVYLGKLITLVWTNIYIGQLYHLVNCVMVNDEREAQEKPGTAISTNRPRRTCMVAAGQATVNRKKLWHNHQ